MKTELNQIGAVAGGAFAGGVAMKLTKKSDGTSNPIGSVGAAALGIYLATKMKSPVLKNIGLGMAAVGVVGIVGNVAQKVPAMQKFAPTINGLNGDDDVYMDEDGNIIELGGINGPQLVTDDQGNTYMVDGLEGDELDDLTGLEGDDEYYDEFEDDLDGVDELDELT